VADATIAANHKSSAIETFLTDGTDEIEVVVKRVALEGLREPPFKAAVDFEKTYVSRGDHVERKRERYIGHFVFVVKDRVPNALVPIRPLGLTTTPSVRARRSNARPSCSPMGCWRRLSSWWRRRSG